MILFLQVEYFVKYAYNPDFQIDLKIVLFFMTQKDVALYSNVKVYIKNSH